MSGPESSGDYNEREEIKKPEFIYVDDRSSRSGASWQYFHQRYAGPFEHIAKKGFPLSVRLTFFVIAALLLAIVFLSSFFILAFFLINAVTFFTMKVFWRKTKETWEVFKKILVTSMGLFIAVISPAFGLAIIVLYLFLKGKPLDDHFVLKMMSRRF